MSIVHTCPPQYITNKRETCFVYVIQTPHTDESLDETLPHDVFDHSAELTSANSSIRQPAAAFAATMPITHHRTPTNNNNNGIGGNRTSLKLAAVRKQVSNLSIKAPLRQQPVATVRLAPVATAALMPPPGSATRSMAVGGVRKLVPMKKTGAATTTAPLAAAAAARKSMTVARPAAPVSEKQQVRVFSFVLIFTYKMYYLLSRYFHSIPTYLV